jgi:hypothetical protein
MVYDRGEYCCYNVRNYQVPSSLTVFQGEHWYDTELDIIWAFEAYRVRWGHLSDAALHEPVVQTERGCSLRKCVCPPVEK